MKALSLWQPWASLVASGVKTIETRSWKTSYRGQLAIHAAKRVPWKSNADEGQRAAAMSDEIPRPLWEAMRAHVDEYPLLWAARLPRGVIVATGTLVDVLPIIGREPTPHDEIPACFAVDRDGTLRLWTRSDLSGYPGYVGTGQHHAQLPYGDFTDGRYAWILDDIVELDPVPATGHQGLWEWRH